jgi:hypothetical protein
MGSSSTVPLSCTQPVHAPAVPCALPAGQQSCATQFRVMECCIHIMPQMTGHTRAGEASKLAENHCQRVSAQLRHASVCIIGAQWDACAGSSPVMPLCIASLLLKLLHRAFAQLPPPHCSPLNLGCRGPLPLGSTCCFPDTTAMLLTQP